jgi:hypothetical protein
MNRHHPYGGGYENPRRGGQAAVQTEPTDLVVTGVVRVEEAVTAVEEVAPIIKRRTIPHTVILLQVPMIKATCKATTTDMVVHHLKTLTIRIIPLLPHILPFQNSPVPIRITHPTKVRSEAMIEVFVGCISSLFAVSTQDHISQGVGCFPSLPSSPPILRGFPMRFN